MLDVIRLIFALIADLFRSRAAMEAEVLVLRQQIICCVGASQVGCHF